MAGGLGRFKDFIQNDNEIVEVHKFKSLCSYLAEQAKTVALGLSLTNSNYDAALNLSKATWDTLSDYVCISMISSTWHKYTAKRLYCLRTF